MGKGTVTIPKEEYDLLLKCRHILRSDFEEKFSAQFIKEVKESEEAFRAGNFKKFKTVNEARAYVDRE